MLTPVRIRPFTLVKNLSDPDSNNRVLAQGWADGVPIIAKSLPRHELIREVLCNLLAQAVEIPVPECFVVENEHVQPANPLIKQHWFATQYTGASSFSRVARSNLTQSTDLTKWVHFLPSIGFDTWIGNQDRTMTNLLFEGRNRYSLIDHGEALPQDMRPESRYRNNLAEILIARNKQLSQDNLAEKVKQKIGHFANVDFAQIVIAGLPDGWNGNSEFWNCCQLLRHRAEYLPELIDAVFRTSQGQILWNIKDEDA